MAKALLPVFALLIGLAAAPIARAATEDDGDGDGDIGEAFMTHVLWCEGAMAGDEPVVGRDAAALRRAIARQGQDIEQFCGCTGQAYLDGYRALWAELDAKPDDPQVYDRHLARMIDSCLQSGGAAAPVPPVTLGNLRSGAICLGVINGTIAAADHDAAMQAQWQEGSGLTPEDLCECTEAVIADGLPEEDIYAADDPDAFLLDAVLMASDECRNAMWRN